MTLDSLLKKTGHWIPDGQTYSQRTVAVLFCMAIILGLSACGDNHKKSHQLTGDQSSQTMPPLRLKVASSYPMTVPILGENIQYLTDRAARASQGSLSFKIYNPGELVGTLEILEAVSSGKVELGYSAAGFWKGKLPASPLFATVPFGPNASEYLAWLIAGDGMNLYQEMYDRAGYNVKVLLCAMIAPETSGWFSKKIESLQDLQGLKMRFYGLGGNVMSKLGVSVSLTPGAEVFQDLEKGVIDATEYSMPIIDEKLELYKLAKFNYFPGWHQQSTTFELLVHRKVWDSMHPTQQLILEMACRDTIVQSIAQSEAVQSQVLIRNQNERGVESVDWSPEMLEAFRLAWTEVVQEECQKDPFFAKVWDNFSNFRANYKIWGDKAYLDPSPK